MALQEAQQFLSYVDHDQQLQGMLNVVAWNPRATTDLAATRGFAFSPDDLQTAIRVTWGDLSEDDLMNISGGDPGNADHPFPPPGHNDDRENGWSPPPGDVSGRSCFFGRK